MKPSYLCDLDAHSPAPYMPLYGIQWAFIVFPSLVVMVKLGAAALGSGSAGTVYFLQWTLLPLMKTRFVHEKIRHRSLLLAQLPSR